MNKPYDYICVMLKNNIDPFYKFECLSNALSDKLPDNQQLVDKLTYEEKQKLINKISKSKLNMEGYRKGKSEKFNE